MSNRKCAVPSCLFKNSKDVKRSMFRCPKNEMKALLWAESIPGLNVLGPNQHVCEIHFEENLITRYTDAATATNRVRLATNAIPTIFDINANQKLGHHVYNGKRHSIGNTYMDKNVYESSTSLLNSSLQQPVNDFRGLELSNIKINNSKSNQTSRTKTSITDIMKDLSASAQILMKIKKEELFDEPRVKLETCSDNATMKEVEESYEMKELSAYEELKSNFDYYITLMPDGWNAARLLIDKDEVFTFSKECTVSENGALVVMYEKNIVLKSNGNVNYSIHGKMVTVDNSDFPKVISDIKSLLSIIEKFSDLKVCQGIITREFEVDKDFIIFKDDLGKCRHINCIMITDAEQCDFCYKYNQYLLELRFNNMQLLNHRVTYSNQF